MCWIETVQMSFIKNISSQFFNSSNISNSITFFTNYNTVSTNDDCDKPILSRITIESLDCTLFNAAHLSSGSLFRAMFLLTVKPNYPITISTVNIELIQNIIIVPSLIPTCKQCGRNSMNSEIVIKNWKLLSHPKIFVPGNYTTPLSCHIDGKLVATAKFGMKKDSKIYKLITTIHYKTNYSNIL